MLYLTSQYILKCLYEQDKVQIQLRCARKKFHNFEASANTGKAWLSPVILTYKTLFLFQLLQKDVRNPVTSPTDVGPVILVAQMYINARVPLICAMEL